MLLIKLYFHYSLSSADTWANIPDSKVHGANMGPTWVLSAPRGPHVGPMNLAIWDASPLHVRRPLVTTSSDNYLLFLLCCHVATDVAPISIQCNVTDILVLHLTLVINTLRPRQNGRHFPDDIFKWIGFSWIKMYEFRLTFHWSLFLGAQLTIFQHWFR